MALHDPIPLPQLDGAHVSPAPRHFILPAQLPVRQLWSLHAVAGQLGQRFRVCFNARTGEEVRHPRSVAWICKYLDGLIACAGFPPPLPLVRGGELFRGAHRDSRWPAEAVEAWIAGQAPPPLTAAIEDAALTAASNRIDANAGKLRLVSGGAA